MNESFKKYKLSSPSNITELNQLSLFGYADRKKHIARTYKTGYTLKFVNHLEEEVISNSTSDTPHWTFFLNNYNFRGEWNFVDKRKRIGFFGCSFTFGEGIHSRYTFVNQVSTHFDLNPFNFGVGGSSIERVVRTFSSATNAINLDYAVITLPSWYRCLYLDPHGKLINLIPNITQSRYEAITELLMKLDDDYYINHTISYVNWMVDVAKLKNIKILLSSWDHSVNALCKELFPSITLDPFPNIDDKCARDKLHPGTKSQTAHAKQIIEAINDQTWI